LLGVALHFGNLERKLFASVAKVRKETYFRYVSLSVGLSFLPSFRPSAWNNSAPTGRIFMKFDVRVFFENL
jgi:hypothetical protein